MYYLIHNLDIPSASLHEYWILEKLTIGSFEKYRAALNFCFITWSFLCGFPVWCLILTERLKAHQGITSRLKTAENLPKSRYVCYLLSQSNTNSDVLIFPANNLEPTEKMDGPITYKRVLTFSKKAT